MKVGYCFDGMAPVPEMVALARDAEAAGVDSLWFAEHLGFRDAFAPAMACLAVTGRVTVAPAAVTPYTRHPIIAAMTAATLAECAPGRVVLTVASGNPVALGECGLEPARPLAAIREFAAIVRGLWRGEAVTSGGPCFRMRGARLEFTPPAPIPLYIAAMRPRMLDLAGEIGEGVLLSGGISPVFIRRSVEQVRAGARRFGRPPEEVLVAGFIVTSIHPDEGEALRGSREFLAYLFRSRAFTENLELTGTPLDQEALAAHLARRDWQAAARLIPDEIVHRYSVTGTLTAGRDRLQEFLDAGLALPVLMPVGAAEQRQQTITLAHELVRG